MTYTKMIDKIRLSINVADCPDGMDMRCVASDAIAGVGGTPECKINKRTGGEYVEGNVLGMFLKAGAGYLRVSGSLPKYYFQGYGVLTIADYRDAIEKLSKSLYLPIESLKLARVTELEIHRDKVLPSKYSEFEGRISKLRGWQLQKREQGTRYYISERARAGNWRKQSKRVKMYDKSQELREVQKIPIDSELMRVEITLKGDCLRRCGIETARDIGTPEGWFALCDFIDEVINDIILYDDTMNDTQLRAFAKKASDQIDMLALIKLAGGYDEAEGILKEMKAEGIVSTNTYYKKIRLLKQALSEEMEEQAKSDPMLQALRGE